MTKDEMLELLGDMDPQYILEGQRLRSGQKYCMCRTYVTSISRAQAAIRNAPTKNRPTRMVTISV